LSKKIIRFLEIVHVFLKIIRYCDGFHTIDNYLVLTDILEDFNRNSMYESIDDTTVFITIHKNIDIDIIQLKDY